MSESRKILLDRAAVEAYQAAGGGLGDLIAAVTKKFGVAPCDGCEERRKKLNRIRLPFAHRAKKA